MNRRRAFAALVGPAFALGTRAVRAQTPGGALALTPVTIAVNAPGAANWLLYLAQHAGLFRAQGLDVGIVTSGAPVTTLEAVAAGSTNFGLSGTDAEIEAIAHGLTIKIVAPAFVPIPYVLLTTQDIHSWDDLKGKKIILGAAGDVSSITFDLLAAQHHLSRADFDVVRGPTSSARYQALMSGNVQGTILSQPFSILAADNGMRTLLIARDTIGQWLDTCLIVNVPWAAANRPVAVRFVRAFVQAVRYGYAHRDESIAALVTIARIAPATAAKAYDLDFTRWHAFDPNMQRHVGDLQAMVRIVAQAGTVAAVPALADLYDGSLTADATR